jgi:hypothetical protein
MLSERTPTGRWPVVCRHLLATASLVGVGLLLFTVLLVLAQRYGDWWACFNTDDLYLVALCDSVLEGNVCLTGWNLPLAPYLFPDLLLLLLCRPFAPDLAVLFLVYAGLFCSLLAGAVAWVGCECGLPWRRALLVGLLGMGLLLAAHTSGAGLARGLLLYHAGNHAGGILVGLCTAALVFRFLRQGGGTWLALPLALVSVGSLSDRLVVAQFLAPLCLALGYLGLRRFISWRSACGAVLLLVTGVLLGLALERALEQAGAVFQTTLLRPKGPSLAALGATTWQFVTADVPGWLRTEPLLAAVLAFHATVAASLTLRLSAVLARKRGQADSTGRAGREVPRLLLALTLLLGPLCNAACVILGSAGTGAVSVLDRYFLAAACLPFLTLGLVPFALGAWPRLLAGLLGLTAATVAAIVAWQAPTWEMPRQPYPELARALDQLVVDEGHEQGLGGYWTARYCHYLTRRRVRLATALGHGEPWLHGNHPGAYLPGSDRTARPRFTFIVLRAGEAEPRPEPASIRAEYGEPARKLVVGTDQVWLYPALHSCKLDLFLDSICADRVRRSCRVVAPTSPVALAHPRRNQTRKAAWGVQWVPPGRTIEVSFAEPVRGDLIDVSAASWDRCVLTFFADDVALARLILPPVPWTGAASGDPGLQTRLLPVPPDLSGRAWTRVVIAPASDAGFCLGHFLVLQCAAGSLPAR